MADETIRLNISLILTAKPPRCHIEAASVYENTVGFAYT